MHDDAIVSASLQEGERQFEAALRPRLLDDFAGQSKIKENLAIAIEAAKKRGEAMDHVAFATVLPGSVRRRLPESSRPSLAVGGWQQTSGPVLQKKLDLVGILEQHLRERSFLRDRNSPPAT